MINRKEIQSPFSLWTFSFSSTNSDKWPGSRHSSPCLQRPSFLIPSSINNYTSVTLHRVMGVQNKEKKQKKNVYILFILCSVTQLRGWSWRSRSAVYTRHTFNCLCSLCGIYTATFVWKINDAGMWVALVTSRPAQATMICPLEGHVFTVARRRCPTRSSSLISDDNTLMINWFDDFLQSTMEQC